MSNKSQLKTKTSRREFLKRSSALAGLVTFGLAPAKTATAAETQKAFEITRSIKEWKALLTPNQFAILREEATERKGSSPLLSEKRPGTYHCAGCDLPAYSSQTKYDSKTGWPSFWQSLENAVLTKEDNTFFSTRLEVHCRRCGSHFGHIFNDGPEPTGKRHCLNGIALQFNPTVS